MYAWLIAAPIWSFKLQTNNERQSHVWGNKNTYSRLWLSVGYKQQRWYKKIRVKCLLRIASQKAEAWTNSWTPKRPTGVSMLTALNVSYVAHNTVEETVYELHLNTQRQHSKKCEWFINQGDNTGMNSRKKTIGLVQQIDGTRVADANERPKQQPTTNYMQTN